MRGAKEMTKSTAPVLKLLHRDVRLPSAAQEGQTGFIPIPSWLLQSSKVWQSHRAQLSTGENLWPADAPGAHGEEAVRC